MCPNAGMDVEDSHQILLQASTYNPSGKLAALDASLAIIFPVNTRCTLSTGTTKNTNKARKLVRIPPTDRFIRRKISPFRFHTAPAERFLHSFFVCVAECYTAGFLPLSPKSGKSLGSSRQYTIPAWSSLPSGVSFQPQRPRNCLKTRISNPRHRQQRIVPGRQYSHLILYCIWSLKQRR